MIIYAMSQEHQATLDKLQEKVANSGIGDAILTEEEYAKWVVLRVISDFSRGEAEHKLSNAAAWVSIIMRKGAERQLRADREAIDKIYETEKKQVQMKLRSIL